jgi:hypothetical protein
MGKRAFTGLFAGAALVVAYVAGGCSSSSTGETKACSITAPSADDFCTALASYDGRCGHCEDCVGKNLRNCEKRGASISATHRAAFVACKDEMPCIDDTAHASCILDRIRGATPTAAQVQAKDAYCAACGATSAGCQGFFDVGADIGKTGPGYNILLGSDLVAQRAIMLCASKCVPFDYAVCVGLIHCAEAGGDFCADGGFCGVKE